MALSEIEVEKVRGNTNLVTEKSEKPLKILNPGSDAHACHIVLSNYGGGFVTGDAIHLNIKCGSGSSAFLGTQANTRIYKSDEGEKCTQHICGTLEKDAVLVMLPDPLVLQEGSCFEQYQEWYMEPGSMLFIMDWLIPGRVDAGEKFAFRNYVSSVKIYQCNQLLLFDSFAFDPGHINAYSAGNFGDYNGFMMGYLVGSAADKNFQTVADTLSEYQRSLMLPSVHADQYMEQQAFSLIKKNENTCMLRGAIHTRKTVDHIYDILGTAFAANNFLGFNPFQRKF